MILACIMKPFSVLFHDIILFGSSLTQLASFPRFSLFAFLNQILFDLVCMSFVFGLSTDRSKVLCCLATQTWCSVRHFFRA